MLMLFITACGGGNEGTTEDTPEEQTTSESTTDGGEDADAEAEAEATGEVPQTLRVQFVPSQNAGSLEAKAKPLEGLLTEQLDIPVEVSVSTSYNTVIEAMMSDQIDVGFLPPTTYVLAHEQGAADVILQAQRYGVNDEDGTPTDELVDAYKSIIIAKADSDINSVEDLKGKTIAIQDFTSSAGYVWPAALMLDNGIDPLNDINGVNFKGHDAAVLALMDGSVDAAAVFQDARNIVKGDYPAIFEETKIVAMTEWIPNDTIAIRPEIDDEFATKVQQAFIEIGKSEEGHAIISDIYSHEGYVESDNSNFDIVREYAEKVKTE